MCNCNIVQCFTIRAGLKPIDPNASDWVPGWSCLLSAVQLHTTGCRCNTENNWSPHLPRRCYTENNWSPHLPRQCYTENNWSPHLPRQCYTENNWFPHLPRRCYTETNWSPHLPRRCYTENNWSPHLLRLWLPSLVTHFKMTYFFLFKAFINEQYFSFFLENNNICCM